MLGIAATIPVHKLGNLYGFLAPMLPLLLRLWMLQNLSRFGRPPLAPLPPQVLTAWLSYSHG